jgi:hypothetical protein
VLGRRLAYVNVPDEVARKSIVEKGMVPAYAEAMIGLIKMLRELGRIDPTPTVADLLGRAATSFESFVQANASAFR